MGVALGLCGVCTRLIKPALPHLHISHLPRTAGRGPLTPSCLGGHSPKQLPPAWHSPWGAWGWGFSGGLALSPPD